MFYRFPKVGRVRADPCNPCGRCGTYVAVALRVVQLFCMGWLSRHSMLNDIVHRVFDLTSAGIRLTGLVSISVLQFAV